MTSNDKNDVECDYRFKIVIIGDSGVGKTMMLRRFTQDYFSDDHQGTIDIDFRFRTLDVDSKRCKLQIWDTAGQDRFKSVPSSFYRNADGVIICFDITDIESFRNVKNWYDQVKRRSSQYTQIFLIGTKSDLKTECMVSDDMIKTYAEKNKFPYLETSSKTSKNIEECFINFTRTLLQYANQMESNHKDNQIDLSSDHQAVNTGCYGGHKCII